MIEARALVKAFGKVVAVDGVSFAARDGQITGLLGPNGAGKSTCLRMLYGVLSPDSGSACIDGIDILGATSSARAHLGVLPHAAGLYNNLTAHENIAYFASLQGISGERLTERTTYLAGALEMESFIDRRVKGFSQGQRLKVALARALIHDPGNLILDEPTNGLDVMAIRNLRSMLKALKEQGHCILLSSHVMQEVGALCDRIVILGRGRVLADDTPQALRQHSGAASLEEAFLRVLDEAGRDDGSAPGGHVRAPGGVGTEVGEDGKADGDEGDRKDGDGPDRLGLPPGQPGIPDQARRRSVRGRQLVTF